jgi:hypothetical protein
MCYRRVDNTLASGHDLSMSFIEKANGFSVLRLFTMNERVTQFLYV